jgi:hypothetical protein
MAHATMRMHAHDKHTGIDTAANPSTPSVRRSRAAVLNQFLHAGSVSMACAGLAEAHAMLHFLLQRMANLF